MTIFLIIAASVGWTLCVLLGFLFGAAIAPIIHDPMMRAIVHAALLAAAERLERQS